jgi:hypothetical protein
VKFKEGDRVVFVYGHGKVTGEDKRINELDKYYKKGGTVIKRKSSDGICVQFDGEKAPHHMSWFYDWRFVPEDLFNSPLYKALS